MAADKTYMVFDAEAVGLHGTGFAVGYVVIDEAGARLDEGLFACASKDIGGRAEDHEWLAANVPPLPVDCYDEKEVRASFWSVWETWRERGAVLVADCAWPVEARFLADCIDDEPSQRWWRGPYPLHDLASVLLALGRDPLATTARLPDELPAHNPLHDARQSARQLAEALRSAREQAAELEQRLQAGPPAPLHVALGNLQHEVGVGGYGHSPPMFAVYPRRQPGEDGHVVGPPPDPPLLVITFATAAALDTVLHQLHNLRDMMDPRQDPNGIVPVPDEPLVAALGGDLTEARAEFERPYAADPKLTIRSVDGYDYRHPSTTIAWVGFIRGAGWQALRQQQTPTPPETHDGKP